MTFSLVILNRYPDVIAPLLESIQKYEPQRKFPIYVVADRNDHAYPEWIDRVIRPSFSDFCYARNANAAIKESESDVILCNDDVTLMEPKTFTRMAQFCDDEYPDAGILAPLVDGGVGNPYQQYAQRDKLLAKADTGVEILGREADSIPVCFVCAYLRRAMIDEIGLLDERMTGYGFDDNDYCLRSRWAGWRTVILKNFYVRHGEGGEELKRGKNWSQSFAREKVLLENAHYFYRKWKTCTNPSANFYP